ncbi:MAG: hypothetical protein KKA65_01325 [Nanoarchaeota archaeon]|nr:hypothetical protein [Nanoarchaeota archaeon]MBU4241806.1 hypothetical protein [Nanoarchaeota archaeon]MBU4352706.1 hypothetical protein [Nanoarchaeota archaeon]MBU4456118.1 hypothetical protein [Nanoarchaeota archaeon]MCG2720150.1 hypothetical protein [Nanoarchaeota archaeon]
MDGELLRYTLEMDPLEVRVRGDLVNGYMKRTWERFDSNPDIMEQIKAISEENFREFLEREVQQDYITKDGMLAQLAGMDFNVFAEEKIDEVLMSYSNFWLVRSNYFKEQFDELIESFQWQGKSNPALEKRFDDYLEILKRQDKIVDYLLLELKPNPNIEISEEMIKNTFKKEFKSREELSDYFNEEMKISEDLNNLMGFISNYPYLELLEDYNFKMKKIYFKYFIQEEVRYLFS